ncbi:hypothetical protein GQ54DRAFT_70257 [Martensiomyces pterosporus]|nr:hypothetical protein GQ54DRAFT_70257 [Martensiomyces pterosporus]
MIHNTCPSHSPALISTSASAQASCPQTTPPPSPAPATLLPMRYPPPQPHNSPSESPTPWFPCICCGPWRYTPLQLPRKHSRRNMYAMCWCCYNLTFCQDSFCLPPTRPL